MNPLMEELFREPPPKGKKADALKKKMVELDTHIVMDPETETGEAIRAMGEIVENMYAAGVNKPQRAKLFWGFFGRPDILEQVKGISKAEKETREVLGDIYYSLSPSVNFTKGFEKTFEKYAPKFGVTADHIETWEGSTLDKALQMTETRLLFSANMYDSAELLVAPYEIRLDIRPRGQKGPNAYFSSRNNGINFCGYYGDKDQTDLPDPLKKENLSLSGIHALVLDEKGAVTFEGKTLSFPAFKNKNETQRILKHEEFHWASFNLTEQYLDNQEKLKDNPDYTEKKYKRDQNILKREYGFAERDYILSLTSEAFYANKSESSLKYMMNKHEVGANTVSHELGTKARGEILLMKALGMM